MKKSIKDIRRVKKETLYKIGIYDIGKKPKDAHSEGLQTMHECMVDFWFYSLTPNAPMGVIIYKPEDSNMTNAHLLKKRLTLNDVPLEYHDEVAKTIADDIYNCMDSAIEQDRFYQTESRL